MGKSMRSGLERGMSVRSSLLSNGGPGGSSEASDGLSSETVRLSLGSSSEKILTLAESSEVRRHLFVSHEDPSRRSPTSPTKGQVPSLKAALKTSRLVSLRAPASRGAALCISCCRHEGEALDAARFLQAVSGTRAHPKLT